MIVILKNGFQYLTDKVEFYTETMGEPVILFKDEHGIDHEIDHDQVAKISKFP